MISLFVIWRSSTLATRVCTSTVTLLSGTSKSCALHVDFAVSALFWCQESVGCSGLTSWLNGTLGIPVIRGLVDPPLIVRPPAGSGQVPISGVQRELGWKLDRRWRGSMKSLGIPVGVEQMPRLARLAQREVPKFGLWPAWLLGESASSLPIPAMGFVSFQGGDASKPPTFCLPEDGKRRVIFVAGSAGTRNWWTTEFARTSAEACRKLGCSGLVLGATSSTDVECLAEGVFSTAYFPLDDALRQAVAIVHHGGIGTAAAAMRQGVPQLIVPRMFSQPSNAEWLRRLGVAVVLDPREYVLERVVETMAGILGGATLRPRALQVMGRSFQETEGERLCNFLETWSVRAREKRALSGT